MADDRVEGAPEADSATTAIQDEAELSSAQFGVAHSTFAEFVQNDKLMCRILEEFCGSDDSRHNCLGCNFNQLTEQIDKFLALCVANPGHFTLAESYSILVLLLNGLWQRMSDVFDLISLPESYIARYFAVFVRVRRWANFFKHPGAFGWLVHHPEFTIQGTQHHHLLTRNPAYRIVDDAFVKRFYASDSAKGLSKQFEGHENEVLVALPDLHEVMPQVCDALARFVAVIIDNPVYKEILDERSTIIHYLEEAEDVATQYDD